MGISRLHYISQELNGKTHEQLIEEACQAGVDWVQLRVKEKSFEETLAIAHRVREICNKHNVQFIVNDHIGIAKDVKADGVHLGKEDIHPAKAREILGNNFIIGATANTIHDVRAHHLARVDYIGLGPFRFTTTKQNLSPVLGLDGYRNIIMQCYLDNLSIPVIGIGGILPEDVAPIIGAGLHGVAVSAVINTAENKEKTVGYFHSELKQLTNRKTI